MDGQEGMMTNFRMKMNVENYRMKDMGDNGISQALRN